VDRGFGFEFDPDNEFIDALIEKIGETEYNAYSFLNTTKARLTTISFT
jgi:hypothetical protein